MIDDNDQTTNVMLCYDDDKFCMDDGVSQKPPFVSLFLLFFSLICFLHNHDMAWALGFYMGVMRLVQLLFMSLAFCLTPPFFSLLVVFHWSVCHFFLRYHALCFCNSCCFLLEFVF